MSNTIADSRLFLRPFTTLGFNTHFQLGANYDLWKIFSVGASGYDIVPTGQQTVFSKVSGGSANAGAASHGRVFANNQQTTGTADIANDHGFSIWVDASPGHYFDMELGFAQHALRLKFGFIHDWIEPRTVGSRLQQEVDRTWVRRRKR